MTDRESVFRDALVSARPYVVGGQPDVLAKLNQNESPFDLPDDLKSELARRFGALSLNRYPSEQPTRLLEALAAYVGVPDENVLVTHGSNEFVHTLCVALVEPGRTVVLPTPMFSLFGNAVELFGGSLRTVPCRPDFSYDVDQIVEAASEPAAMVVLACPNNPTGKDLSINSLRRILEVAAGIVVVDEAYWEFTQRPSATSLLNEFPNLVVMRTLSKAFGLAAMRIGYVVANAWVIEQFMKARLPFMVDPFAEEVGLVVLGARDRLLPRVEKMLAVKQNMCADLRALGVNVIDSDTNFVLFRTSADAEELRLALAESGVVVRSMGGYAELDGFLRVNAGTLDENQRFISALKSALFAQSGS